LMLYHCPFLILLSFGTFFSGLVYWTKKNLATLIAISKVRKTLLPGETPHHSRSSLEANLMLITTPGFCCLCNVCRATWVVYIFLTSIVPITRSGNWEGFRIPMAIN
jgi:hypothetical protein